ncbi:hypothetical protein BB560_003632 [Smittium megazygosporum]|uniref:Uncharacterized protein n=1 Tax=Smittium megazygosporum TaxID=133381 RepID=A0A2T9ZBH3_9FUNG|nr:hypothetical protein BB560_003632 [Smittium megazygosporum]
MSSSTYVALLSKGVDSSKMSLSTQSNTASKFLEYAKNVSLNHIGGEFWCMNSPSEESYRESQTAISGLGRRVGQLDAGQTENAEYQGTKPDQSPHVRLAS